MPHRRSHLIAVIGAVVVFVSTAITWYTREVSVAAAAGQVGFSSSNSYTLWDLTTLAPVLLVVAAASAAVLVLFAPPDSSRPAAAAAGLMGLGITAYCVVKCFDLPDLGPTGALQGLVLLPEGGSGVSASASTVLNAGPFVGLVGGLMLFAGAVGLGIEEPRASTAARGSGAYPDSESPTFSGTTPSQPSA
jgi:hypothetical protein